MKRKPLGAPQDRHSGKRARRKSLEKLRHMAKLARKTLALKRSREQPSSL